MRILITSIGLALVLFSCQSETSQSTNKKDAERPNILFVMTDDHAQQAISAYGSQLIETPNIDRLAKEGMLFNHAYVTNSICAPSRAVILTGKYSHVNGVLDNKMPFDSTQQTFPKLLQAAGYNTAMVGKWHLKTTPTGFDYYKILPGQGRYYNPVFKTAKGKETIEGHNTTITTDIALDWLANKRDTTKPFLMLYQHKAPHRGWYPEPQHTRINHQYPVPDTYFDDYEGRGQAAKQAEMRVAEHMGPSWDLKVQPPEPLNIKEGDGRTNNYRWTYKSMSEEQRLAWDAVYDTVTQAYHHASLKGREMDIWKYQRYMQDYLACVQEVDNNLGRILDYLDENNLTENTLVVYTSDQGFYLGEHGWFDKRFMYEESFHTPLIIRWPKVIAAGEVNDDFVMNLDFASTFLQAAGVNVLQDMQGESFLPILKGESPENWRESMYYHYYEYPGAHSVKRHYGIKTKDYKLIHFYYDIDEWELYDLQKDPKEMNNVINKPEYAEIVDQMKNQLKGLQNQYGDSEALRKQYVQDMLVKRK